MSDDEITSSTRKKRARAEERVDRFLVWASLFFKIATGVMALVASGAATAFAVAGRWDAAVAAAVVAVAVGWINERSGV